MIGPRQTRSFHPHELTKCNCHARGVSPASSCATSHVLLRMKPHSFAGIGVDSSYRINKSSAMIDDVVGESVTGQSVVSLQLVSEYDGAW